MIKSYSSKVGGTQLQNKSIRGTQQEKGWELLHYANRMLKKRGILPTFLPKHRFLVKDMRRDQYTN